MRSDKERVGSYDPSVWSACLKHGQFMFCGQRQANQSWDISNHLITIAMRRGDKHLVVVKQKYTVPEYIPLPIYQELYYRRKPSTKKLYKMSK